MNKPFVGKHYVVALKGWPELSARERIAAEVRFATEFERALGGADAIPDSWAAYLDALEADPGPDDVQAARCAFVQAQRRAAAAGWSSLAAPPADAHFKLETDAAAGQISEVADRYFARR
jgi:hypothetical protein